MKRVFGGILLVGAAVLDGLPVTRWLQVRARGPPSVSDADVDAAMKRQVKAAAACALYAAWEADAHACNDCATALAEARKRHQLRADRMWEESLRDHSEQLQQEGGPLYQLVVITGRPTRMLCVKHKPLGSMPPSNYKRTVHPTRATVRAVLEAKARRDHMWNANVHLRQAWLPWLARGMKNVHTPSVVEAVEAAGLPLLRPTLFGKVPPMPPPLPVDV